jgi:hypothetical protein
MEYIVTNIELQIEVNSPFILQIIPILSGNNIGKFAYDLVSLQLFPNSFKNIDYEVVELNSKVFQVDATPPTLSNEAVEIPLEYQLPFVGGFFRLNDFAIPLETYQDKKIVNVAYFLWKEFRAELDTLEPDGSFKYKALKDSLMKLWDYFANEYINGRTIKL